MKKLRITLNEKIYDVMVEVLEDDESHYPGAGLPPAPVSASASTPVAPPVKPRRPVEQTSGNYVLAPIVGTVTRILVEPGAAVKENQPLIILDAMKMDTYINAPRAGVVQSIECKVGDSVHVGQKMVSMN
jgi:glutaconyl-CoA/methylmalonyl-CoA decarboxylase subunit gamma